MEIDPAQSLRFPDAPKLELDQLIDQLVERAQDVKRVQGRLRALLRAIELVTSDLSLESVLTNIVEAARELSGAEYGGLGVLSRDGGLERFIHVGIPEEVIRAIGRDPEGKGLIGALISDPRPIRIVGPSSDPRAVGFPDGHPPMASFLGVPIHVRDEVFGNLYLGNAASGEFTVEDEELMTALALAAGSAISNARLYQESRLQQRWLRASADIGTQLLTNPEAEPLDLIARRALEVAEADRVAIGVMTPDRGAMVIECSVGVDSEAILGRRFELMDSAYGQALATGEALILDDARADEVADRAVHQGTALDPGPVMVLPLVGTGDVRGAISLLRSRGRRVFTESDRVMATGFASHASIALELSDSRTAEQRLLLLEDRDRIAMDLHDHVIQELFAIGLGLESTATSLGLDHPAAERLVKRVDDVDRVIKRIRTSIFELRGAVMSSADGVRQRVLAMATELKPALGFAPSVTFAGPLDQRFDPGFVDDVTACVRESLTNAAKHADASAVSVEVRVGSGVLTVRVADDGVGPGTSARSSGTSNLRARAERRGGSYAIEAGAETGTVVTWSVPVSVLP